MNERDIIINSILNDDSIETPDIIRTERLLEEELIRDNPDLELIDELTKLLSELKGIEFRDTDVGNELAEIKRKATGISRKYLGVRKILGIAASLILVCALLYKPLIASGMIDRFPALKSIKGHFFADLKDSANPEKKAGKEFDHDDPYSIKSLASVYGMNVFTPTYMPEGEFTFGNKCENIDGIQQCIFSFFWDEEGKAPYMCKKVHITYKAVTSDNLDIIDPDINSPGITVYPMEQTVVCGIDAYISSFYEPDTKNDVFIMKFYCKESNENGILTTVMCQNLTKEEAYTVFNSFK